MKLFKNSFTVSSGSRELSGLYALYSFKIEASLCFFGLFLFHGLFMCMILVRRLNNL